MTIGVGIVGMGFMGRRHAANVTHLTGEGGGCRMVAVHSQGIRSRDQLVEQSHEGNIKRDDDSGGWIDRVEIKSSYEELIANPGIDCVIVCTPTPTHVDLAARALDAGKHVLVEKPVSLAASGVERLMAHHAKTDGLVCMPAHVIRFWPGWTCIRRAIRDGRFGRVLSASFRRLGTVPDWNPAFYSDLHASGGALVDLHIHDVDFIIDCFGAPDTVRASGDAMHVTGMYEYENGPRHVVAEAGWDHQAGFGFRMQCVVNFEHATMEFDSLREPPLVVIQGEQVDAIDESHGDGYLEELRSYIHAVRGEHSVPVTMEDALRAARVIDRERACIKRSKDLEHG